MTTFAPHRATLESFVDCIHGGVDENTLSRLLAEVSIVYRILPSGVALQRNLAGAIGMQPWELRTGRR